MADQKTAFAPTGNNAATATGGALAALYVILHPQQFSADQAIALGVASSTLFGYFHSVIATLIDRVVPPNGPPDRT